MNIALAGSRSLRPIRARDFVVVRSKQEILATLDQRGLFENLPFMPEMLRYCGRRFRVRAVAHKTCDPAHKTGGRRLENVVHLEELRCDGSAHGGCQAACLLFWKTAWLRLADVAEDRSLEAEPIGIELDATTTVNDAAGNKIIFSCQATRLFDASKPLPWWQPLQYVRDVAYGNVRLGYAIKVLVLSWLRALRRTGIGYRAVTAVYRYAHRKLFGRLAPIDQGVIPLGQPTPCKQLGLQPGELVRVKSHNAICQTLNVRNKNRGMWYDEEMSQFCDGTYRVAARIERIINEVTGEMMTMKSPCITLEGVNCRSIYSRGRLFCPRAITPYWREDWLERAETRPL
jgi:hypothetical protein